MTPPSKKHNPFAALAVRDFRIFYMGQLVSLLGNWTRIAALGWLAFHLTGSEFWLGMMAVVTNLPVLLFSPLAGSLADRVPKLRVVQASNLAAMGISGTLAALLFTHHEGVTELYVMGALWGTVAAFEMPARQAMVVELAGKSQLTNAIALNSAAVHATRILGPALGGLLLGAVGAAWCFALDAISFAGVLGSTFYLKAAPSPPRHAGGALLHLKEGARAVWRHSGMRRAMSMLTVMSLLGWPYMSQMASFAKKGLGLDATGYGLLLACNGLGALGAALTVAWFGDEVNKEKQMLWGSGIFTLGLFGATLAPDAQTTGVGLIVAGYGLVLFLATTNTLVQSLCPDALRGRIMGLYTFLFIGGMPLGSLWMGIAAGAWGVRPALQAAAVTSTLAVFAVEWAERRRLK